MISINRFRVFLALSLSGLLWSAGSSGQTSVPEVERLNAGQRLTFVLPDTTGADEDARARYVEGAFPIAEKHGFTELQIFSIAKTLAGETTPQALALYSWPSAEASQTSRTDPTYLKNFRPLRRQAWSGIDIIDVDLQEALELMFDPLKTYTLAVIWLNDKERYKEYYEGTSPVREQLGVKTLLKADVAEYDSQTDGQRSPDMLVLLEWPDEKGPEKYLDTPLFDQYRPVVSEAIGRIDWYHLSFLDAY